MKVPRSFRLFACTDQESESKDEQSSKASVYESRHEIIKITKLSQNVSTTDLKNCPC